ncbi:hypothetical protein [Spirulina subsalsa]|uniref:hypothetical protein n=1 Tax=Spirulina subsalsa TaxID=54311 RepID=UPI00030F017A|nr:hypothetical protein [Spirulina subsalsa]
MAQNLPLTNPLLGNHIEMQEVAVAIAATDLNPGSISLDFLRFSGIIPTDWELTQQPVLNNAVAQLNFSNGVNIFAQPRSINFLEAIKQNPQDLQAPIVARQYLEKLPHANYQGISINPKILIGFPNQEDAARKYIVETLLAPGGWQQLGQAPLKASVNLSYQLKRCPLNLGINEVRLQQPDQTSIAALLFSGGFTYGIPPEYQDQKTAYLSKRISTWQTDFETFREIITKKFFAQSQGSSLFPPTLM